MSEREPLPETIERHQKSFRRGDGAGFFALVIAPGGDGFRVTLGDGEESENEHLTSAEMLAEIMSVYGVSAFKVN